jgi:hypothetical protein
MVKYFGDGVLNGGVDGTEEVRLMRLGSTLTRSVRQGKAEKKAGRLLPRTFSGFLNERRVGKELV